MGIIASQTEQSQFVQGLRLAREGGWNDVDIARTLCVSNGDFKNMLTGHKPPSPKHMSRLNGLMKSNPPKSVETAPLRTPPPAPSRPVMNLPKFNASKADIPKGREVLFIGDDGGHPRAARPDAEAAPAPTEPPKERTEMTTTEAVNGISNGAKNTHEDPNARYRLLSRGDAKTLREAMNKAFLRTYVGDFEKMAKALHLTPNGLRKTLQNKAGSISEQTRNRFAKATGWTFTAQPTKERAAHTRKPRAKKPSAASGGASVKNKGRVPTKAMKGFRAELREAVEKAGNMAEVGRGMGISRSTIAFILDGRGTSYDTLDRFQKYRERLGGTIAEARAAAPKRKLLDAYGPSDTRGEKVPMDGFDLYGMAGRLLAGGHPGEAHILSLVARVSEAVPLERITEALSRLLPLAAAG